MRVKMKGVGSAVYDVWEESTRFYIVRLTDTEYFALPKSDWEPVTEWVDVTKECVVEPADDGRTISFRHKGVLVCGLNDYQVKPQIVRGDDGRNYHCFIVEKQQ